MFTNGHKIKINPIKHIIRSQSHTASPPRGCINKSKRISVSGRGGEGTHIWFDGEGSKTLFIPKTRRFVFLATVCVMMKQEQLYYNIYVNALNLLFLHLPDVSKSQIKPQVNTNINLNIQLNQKTHNKMSKHTTKHTINTSRFCYLFGRFPKRLLCKITQRFWQ